MITKSRASVKLAAAALIAALALPAAAGETVTRKNGKTIVKAPTTRVETGKNRTTVRVRAPHTKVDVDTDRRRVRIRVPYYSGDITW